MLKKTICIMLSFIIITSVFSSTVLANNLNHKVLDNKIILEKELNFKKEAQLNSIKKQLKEQGKIHHLDLYQKHLDKLIESESGISILRTNSYYAPNGGSVITMYPSSTLTQIYFNLQDTQSLVNSKTLRVTITGLILSSLSKYIPNPIPLLYGLTSVLRINKINKMLIDGYGLHTLSAVDIYGDTSHIYTSWKKMPYIYVDDSYVTKTEIK